MALNLASIESVYEGLDRGKSSIGILGSSKAVNTTDHTILLKKLTQIVLYADYAVVLFQEDTWDKDCAVTEVEMGKIKEWIEESKPTINIDRTNCMCFECYEGSVMDLQLMKIHKYCGKEKECECTDIVGVKTHTYFDFYVQTTIHNFHFPEDFQHSK